MIKNFLIYNSLFLIVFYFVNITFSQDDNYGLRELKITSEDFSKYVHCVVKDQMGFIWFGTEKGLYRFDGHSFKAYRSNPSDTNSLRSEFILTICDDENYLWVGTWGGGLNRFDKTTEQFRVYFPDPNDTNSLSSEHVESICLTSGDEMWVGTRQGLNKFDRVTGKFTRYLKLPGDTNYFYSVRKIIEDKDGYVWVGTFAHGLIRFNEKNNYFKHFRHNDADSSSISSDRISKIIEDSNGDIWIATEWGLNKYHKENDKFKNFINNVSDKDYNFIHSLFMDEDRRILWIGSLSGVSIFNTVSSEFKILKKEDIGDKSVTDNSDIYIDKDGMLWICSYKDGVSCYNKNYNVFNKYENFQKDLFYLGFNSILSIGEDAAGNIWFGTLNEGIYICDKNKKVIQHFPYDENEPIGTGILSVTSIYRDRQNNMWISVRGGGVLKYDPVKKKFDLVFKSEGMTYCILEDRKEHLWLGTTYGISIIDKNGNLKKKYLREKSRNFVFGIMEDSKGNMWIASPAYGVVMIDPFKDSIYYYNHNPKDSTSLSSQRVNSIFEDRNGFLWVATFNGLDKFDPAKKVFTHFNSNRGLQNNRVWSVLPDNKGNLWIGTGSGISMINPENDFIRNFGTEEGVIGLDFSFQSFYKAIDGEMFFAGKEGFISFYPDSISVDQKVYPIFITDFKIFNKEVKLDTSVTKKKEIKISYKENFFSFDYASLDYTNPSKNQYAYMLDGVDKDWNYVVNSHTANYTDIPHGDYTFRVKGSNNDGVWNEEGTSVRLIITPPWYATFWFRCLAGISLIGGIGFIFKQRIKKTKIEKKQQEEFTKKLIESQELERKRIASELHDSLGQDLLIIKNKALISIKKDDEVAKLKEQMNEISQLTSSTLNDVREISYNLRPYELDKLGLTKTILSLIDRANNSTGIKFSGEIDDVDKMFTPDIEINIYRIIQECLNNVIKHSEASEAKIQIKKSGYEIELFISDNGKGFDTERKYYRSEKKGFGLSGIQERVKLLKGSFKIESERRKGAVVKICVPFNG